jgi:hypothetical protein
MPPPSHASSDAVHDIRLRANRQTRVAFGGHLAAEVRASGIRPTAGVAALRG